MVSPVVYVGQAVRRERARAGLSLSELARRAGLSKSTLSQIEAGCGNPSVETLWALSTTLGVPFGSLIDPPEPTVRLLRAGEGRPMLAEHAHYSVTLLSTSPPRARRDLYRVHAQPGADRLSDPHGPGTAEHVVIVAGRAVVGPVHEPTDLAPGDYLRYPGDVPHLFRALKPDTAAVIVLEDVALP